jgi:hypothetical protein
MTLHFITLSQLEGFHLVHRAHDSTGPSTYTIPFVSPFVPPAPIRSWRTWRAYLRGRDFRQIPFLSNFKRRKQNRWNSESSESS